MTTQHVVTTTSAGDAALELTRRPSDDLGTIKPDLFDVALSVERVAEMVADGILASWARQAEECEPR